MNQNTCASDAIFANALENARKMALKAKPWTLKQDGKTYTAVFNMKEWHYDVYEDGIYYMNIVSKTAKIAKAYLKEYLSR